MEKGYRIVECPNCKQKHRLKITPEIYGKTVEVICSNAPKCRTKFRTTIPVPALSPQNVSGEGFDFSAIDELFGKPKK